MAAVEDFLPSKKVAMVVIGMAGQGKSTFLNAVRDFDDDDDDGEEDAFKTASSSHSCTQDCTTLPLKMTSSEGVTFDINLTDTMGFPDPDPDKCREYYDRVIAECNKPQNAIVWVHKASRDNFKQVQQLKVLLREFNRAMPPLILVINGCENYNPRLKPEKLEEKKNIHRQNHCQMGVELAMNAEINIPPMNIIAGADMGDLSGLIKDKLAWLLSNTSPQPSTMKSLQQLEAQMEACKTEVDKVNLMAQAAQAAVEKAERDKETLMNAARLAAEKRERLAKEEAELKVTQGFKKEVESKAKEERDKQKQRMLKIEMDIMSEHKNEVEMKAEQYKNELLRNTEQKTAEAYDGRAAAYWFSSQGYYDELTAAQEARNRRDAADAEILEAQEKEAEAQRKVTMLQSQKIQAAGDVEEREQAIKEAMAEVARLQREAAEKRDAAATAEEERRQKDEEAADKAHEQRAKEALAEQALEKKRQEETMFHRVSSAFDEMMDAFPKRKSKKK